MAKLIQDVAYRLENCIHQRLAKMTSDKSEPKNDPELKKLVSLYLFEAFSRNADNPEWIRGHDRVIAEWNVAVAKESDLETWMSSQKEISRDPWKRVLPLPVILAGRPKMQAPPAVERHTAFSTNEYDRFGTLVGSY
jgi:hypothetical protein